MDNEFEDQEAEQPEETSAADKLRKAIDALMCHADGLLVLKKFYDLSGYGADLMRFNMGTGEINPHSTIYNLSKRDVWKDFRTHMTPEQLSLIELPGD